MLKRIVKRWDGLRLDISRHKAVGISVVLHVMVGSAVAWYAAGHSGSNPSVSEELIFELETRTELATTDLATGDLQRTGPETPETNASAGGRGAASREVASQQVLASWMALSDLREGFRPVLQSAPADSLPGFSPLFGNTLDAEAVAAGLNEGHGFGDGHGKGVIVVTGGGGACPAPGILK